jgi:hypothetical protein
MRLSDIFNPWAALTEARGLAELWRGRADAYTLNIIGLRAANEALQTAHDDHLAAIVELQRANSELRVERDTAWAKLGKRSAGISRGNRTRALRRRGGLLPAPINDMTDAPASHLRIELAD